MVDVLDLARELTAGGERFALATVVWRRSPSSGHVGSRALVRSDGTITGWLAGACAEPTVISESLKAIGEGTPRLLFLGTEEELAEHHRDGVVAIPISCQSEGALEVYVEPFVPPPHVVAVGRSPSAQVVARMAEALGWRATHLPESPDLDGAGVDERSIVIVATQGHFDEDALERALATPAVYVGLIASRRRAESVKAYLRGQGVSDEQLERIHAPAGLDLGHLSPEEIGVAVLAELVQLRAAGKLVSMPQATAAAPSEVHEVVDPVCGMTVMVATARHISTFEGRTYYFCAPGCRKAFEADPKAYLGTSIR
jgi:xanthine dehydrogenase accessory factor